MGCCWMEIRRDMNKPFCYAPWTTIQYSGVYNGGGVSPCCEWRDEKYKGKIEEYQSSEYLNKIKLAMETHNTSFIAFSCQECINTESHGILSARNFIERNINNNKYEIGKINKLDYRPDNLCNLKCRMCSPNSSSLIEEELVSYGLMKLIEKRNTNDVLNFDLSSLRHLAILGGEPTVNKNLFPILDYFIENGMTETVRLQYTTNCTSVNTPWMNRIKQFKEVNVNLSLDGAGKSYEYIRTGAKWNNVEKNIHKIIKSANDYSINMCIQMVNFVLVEDWIEYFFQFDPNKVHMNPMFGTVPGKVDCIPDDIREQKIEYLQSLKHPISDKLVDRFKNYKFNINELTRYKEFNGWQDKVRNTNLLDLDPIFSKILAMV